MEYYDYILGLIPAVFATGAAVPYFLPDVAQTTGIIAGGGLAILLISHSLFINGPVDDRTTEQDSEQSFAGTSSFIASRVDDSRSD